MSSRSLVTVPTAAAGHVDPALRSCTAAQTRAAGEARPRPPVSTGSDPGVDALAVPAVTGGDHVVKLPDFGAAPFLVIWEVTRACALACVHCRADAIARRDPRELTTEEGFRLIDQVRSFAEPAETGIPGARTGSTGRPPLMVLTGGDPMWRKDLAELVRYGAERGLTMALTPSGTAAATRKRLAELKEAGLSRIAVSLDGPDAATHDAFRGVRGSFMWTMKIIDAAVELGLPLQINTTISRRTLPTFHAMTQRVAGFPIALWAVFFLVQTGRGASLDQISAEECEQVLSRLYDLSCTAPFGIKTTEAPHFRRVTWQREQAAGASAVAAHRRRQLRAPRAVNDGNGFVFVDHVGTICPSGFLPMEQGNVRDGNLVDVYRTDPVFRRLREADALGGRCGRCRFRTLCGGSRSRAYSTTGDPYGEDPLCAYEPGPAIEPALEA